MIRTIEGGREGQRIVTPYIRKGDVGLQVPLKQLYYAELLTPRKDGPAYAEIAKAAVDAKLFNISVRVASVASLIQMKKHAVASAEAQRDKHLKDIERLKQTIRSGGSHEY